MARRRMIELAPGARQFERTAREWRDMGAPVWVFDLDAAAEAYAAWARFGYGRDADLADGVIARYYVAMQWLPHCVQPRFLEHVGALFPAEAQLLATDRWGGGDGRAGATHRCWIRRLTCRAGFAAVGSRSGGWFKPPNIDDCKRSDAPRIAGTLPPRDETRTLKLEPARPPGAGLTGQCSTNGRAGVLFGLPVAERPDSAL
jgi:hypothetical protein